MAKVGYGPKDFDPRDYQAAVRKLCSFLWCLERESEYAEHWPPTSIRDALWQCMVRESAAVLESAYMIAEVGPPDFPILEFVGTLVFQLDRMNRAGEAILEDAAPQEDGIIPRWTEAEATGVLCETWASIVQVLPEFRGALKLLELRAEHLPEEPSVRAPTEVAPDVQTTDKPLTPSEAEAGREWTRVIRAMKEEALADEREFDEKDVTDEAAHQYLVELLKDEGGKPSQTLETWRKYVGKFRRVAGNPKRRRRLS